MAGSDVTVMDVALTTIKVTAVAFTVTAVAPVKLVPVIVRCEPLSVKLVMVGAGGFTARIPLWLMPPADAVIVTDRALATGFVVTENVAVVLPAATLTLAGTVASAALELASVATSPPASAGAVSVMVPVEPDPPVTLEGLKVSEASEGGSTVRVAV